MCYVATDDFRRGRRGTTPREYFPKRALSLLPPRAVVVVVVVVVIVVVVRR